MTVLRLGTRRSALATTQSRWVADRLADLGHEVELVEITTEGDRSGELLTTIGGTGVFVSAMVVSSSPLRSPSVVISTSSTS